MAAIVPTTRACSWLPCFDVLPAAAEACPLMVIMVPARNEQLVLDGTFGPGCAPFRRGNPILVVDDASTDDTAGMVEAWAGVRDDRVRLSVCRVPPEAGQRQERGVGPRQAGHDLLDRQDALGLRARRRRSPPHDRRCRTERSGGGRSSHVAPYSRSSGRLGPARRCASPMLRPNALARIPSIKSSSRSAGWIQVSRDRLSPSVWEVDGRFRARLLSAFRRLAVNRDAAGA